MSTESTKGAPHYLAKDEEEQQVGPMPPESKAREEEAILSAAKVHEDQAREEIFSIAEEAALQTQAQEEYRERADAAEGETVSDQMQKITSGANAAEASKNNLITALNRNSEAWNELENTEFKPVQKKRGLGRLMQLLHFAQRPKMNASLERQFDAYKSGMMMKLADQTRFLTDALYDADPGLAEQMKDAIERMAEATKRRRDAESRRLAQENFKEKYRLRTGREASEEAVFVFGENYNDLQKFRAWEESEQKEFRDVLGQIGLGRYQDLSEDHVRDLGNTFGSYSNAGEVFVQQWRDYNARAEQEAADEASGKDGKSRTLDPSKARSAWSSVDRQKTRSIESVKYLHKPPPESDGGDDYMGFFVSSRRYKSSNYDMSRQTERLKDVWVAGAYLHETKRSYPNGYDNLTALTDAGKPVTFSEHAGLVMPDGSPSYSLGRAIVDQVYEDLRKTSDAGAGMARSYYDAERNPLADEQRLRNANVEFGGRISRPEIAERILGVDTKVWASKYDTDVVRGQADRLREEILSPIRQVNGISK